MFARFIKSMLLTSLTILLAACEIENPIEMVRVYSNRTKIERCRTNLSKCAGGYIMFRDAVALERISRNRDGDGVWTVGASRLVADADAKGDAYLSQIQEIVLPDDPRWSEFATKHARQFVISN